MGSCHGLHSCHTAGQHHHVPVAATRMTHAAAVRDLEAYLIADEEFHSTLLSASDNPMFATLRHSVSSLLEGRTELMPFEPNLQAIAWHREVADAVAARNPDAAQAAMLNIVEEALDADEEGTASKHGILLSPTLLEAVSPHIPRFLRFCRLLSGISRSPAIVATPPRRPCAVPCEQKRACPWE